MFAIKVKVVRYRCHQHVSKGPSLTLKVEALHFWCVCSNLLLSKQVFSAALATSSNLQKPLGSQSGNAHFFP